MIFTQFTGPGYEKSDTATERMTSMRNKVEPIFFRIPYGFVSRIRVFVFRLFGMKLGSGNRFESGRIRRISQIQMGNLNHFSEGWCLWPEDSFFGGHKIGLGDNNYFNRNLMIDACNSITVGSHNMFGPDVYVTDSNHTTGIGLNPHQQPMRKGRVIIGNYCWIGAKVVILKDVELGDYCVVAAGAVVTQSFPAGSVVGGVPARPLRNKEIELSESKE
jgi:acetyltransferase-like isoleucine patch superfamily enzyme